MVRNVITFDEILTVKSADQLMRSTYLHRGFPVIDQTGNLAGMITQKDVRKALAAGRTEIPIGEIMIKDIIVCYPDENLRTALQKLGKKDIGRIPVVERTSTRHLIGLITRENIIAAYNRALEEKRS